MLFPFQEELEALKKKLYRRKKEIDIFLESKMDILRRTGQDVKEEWNVSFVEFLGELGLTQEEYELAIRSELKRVEIMLKRHPIDIRTNQFCLDLSEVWLANTDVKYVLDAFACAQVCTA